MTSQKGITLLKIVSDFIAKTNGFERVLSKVNIVSGGNGNCTAEFKVDTDHLNGGGGLHGGFIATLVDCISTYALMTHKDEAKTGVSVDMNINYLKGAKEGDDIIIDAKTLKSGKTLAFLEVTLKNKTNDSIIAKGSHTKYIGQS